MTAKLGKIYNIIIRLIILIVTYTYLYYNLIFFKKISEIEDNFNSIVSDASYSYLLLVIMLMFINWGIEAVKWRYLISKIEKINYLKAVMAVFSGVTVSSFMPNRTGEFLGRVFIFNKANRIQGIFITVIGSISQLLVTIFFGLLSLTYPAYRFIENSSVALIKNYPISFFTGSIFIISILIFISFYFYYNINAVGRISDKIKFLRKLRIKKYIRVFSYYSKKELTRVLYYSFARYCVFTIQYLLLFKLFGLTIPLFNGILYISAIFFITSVVPSFLITEPGIKASVGISLYSLFSNNYITEEIKIIILTTSAVIWIINIIFPGIIGSLCIFNLKFFRKNPISDKL